MNNIFRHIKTVFFSGAIAFPVLMASCNKDGELEKNTQIIQLTVSSFSTDPEAAFSVNINGELVSDSLYNNHRASKTIVRQDGMQHLVVKKETNDSTLLDTLINMPENIATVTLLQLDPGSVPTLVNGGASDVPEDRKMLAFFYSDSVLPEALGVELYACYYDLDTRELLGIDTLAKFDKVIRGELTGFKMVKDSVPGNTTIAYFFQLLDAAGVPFADVLQPFVPERATGSRFDFNKGALGTEKNYINNFTGLRLANGKLLPRSFRLLSY
ncbi:hypothetical protein [Chitinophaga sp. 22620]|uniref:hypothetical protein n=1 Tax=Chitinophaga sp. 22620 TaxID=3453952 RepID=UPI003F861703